VSATINQGSAKIYQFPVGGRAALSGQRQAMPPADVGSTRVDRTPASSGWYHEAAVLEDDRSGKPQ
jgi:hypothetical protein